MPALFYSAPPGEVPLLLAIGHEFVLGSYLGPPLAFWLGEIAFRLAGAFGLYALAQACIVVAYWAVFTLGRAIVGTRHAVLGVLLMVGIAAFTVPSPDFGPAVLAAPLWALALLHYWRAVGDGQRGALVPARARSRPAAAGELCRADPDRADARCSRWRPRAGAARCLNPEPWIAAAAVRHRGVSAYRVAARARAIWSSPVSTTAPRRPAGCRPASGFASRCWLTHLGLVLLVALGERLAAPAARRRAGDRPQSGRAVRAAVRLFLRAGAGGVARSPSRLPAAGSGRSTASRRWWCCPASRSWSPPATRCCSIASGMVSSAWFGLLVAPPVLIVLGMAAAAVDLRRRSQDRAAGQCRGPLLRRQFPAPHRQAARLRDRRRAACAAGRARRAKPAACLFRLGAGAQSVGQRRRYQRRKAASWCGRPPTIPARRRRRSRRSFPTMVPEVPRSFARSVQGLLPLIRLGWAVVRPQGMPASDAITPTQ